MKDVREKGKLSRSQDLTAWSGIAAAAATMPLVLNAGFNQGAEQLVGVRTIADDPEPEVALALLAEGMLSFFAILWPMFAAVVAAVALGAAIQGGVHFRRFRLKAEHLKPVEGLKRVFGTQALWQGAKALLKTLAVGSMLVVVIQFLMPGLLTVGAMPLTAVLSQAGSGTMLLLQASIVAGVLLAVLDIMVVSRRNRKHTMMTKQEIKDETKRTDGDPLIKSQRRSRQLEISRNRMIAAVADADVVVVNPTHVAVALQYTPGAGGAPKVVATGVELLALRIREEATAQRVPVVRDVPVARQLQAQCKLGQEIPHDMFAEVARILAFVMALKARGAAAGTHTAPPSNSSGPHTPGLGSRGPR